jgi:hypothetical protein
MVKDCLQILNFTQNLVNMHYAPDTPKFCTMNWVDHRVIINYYPIAVGIGDVVECAASTIT